MSGNKKLYRDRDEGRILGVCAGLADYFGVDVTLLRILWVAAVIFGFGSGILLYFIAALVMPAKPAQDKSVGKD